MRVKKWYIEWDLASTVSIKQSHIYLEARAVC